MLRTGQDTRIVKWAVEGMVKGVHRRVFHDVQAYVSCRKYDGTSPKSTSDRESGWHRGYFPSLTEPLALSGIFSISKLPPSHNVGCIPTPE